MTVSKGGRFTTIYVGYGLKLGASSYNPIEPPAVNADPLDEPEKSEPNPDKEPVVVADPGEGGEGDDDEDP
jgi:hypothetical protein